ncbi:MAG: CAP domain-containing protein [Tepidisphaerales bacterium]
MAGTSASAENIASGTGTGEGAIRMWWHSPGHHKNMLARQHRTGLGRSGNHWTQMFG